MKMKKNKIGGVEYEFIRKHPKATFNEVSEDESLQNITDAIMKIGGNIKGDALLSNISSIRYFTGKEGIAKIEKKLEDLGYPLKFSEIKTMEWYPESFNVMVNILYKNLFNLTDEDIFELGKSAPRYSLFLKIFMKYLVSVKTLLNKASDYWSKVFDFGKIEVVDIDEKEKYAILRVHGYNKSSISCTYQAGYFLALLSYVTQAKKITIEESACIYRGNDYHEYTIRWI